MGRISQRGNLKPFTVVRDWDPEIFIEGWEQFHMTDEPQLFHVWATSGSNASDEAESEAVKRFGESASYLHAVAVLQGHVPFAQN